MGMRTRKLAVNFASLAILIFMFIMVALFISVQVGIIDQEPNLDITGPDNTTGVPDVKASNYSDLDGEELEMALYEEVNERRVSAGRQELVHSERVRLIARIHSKDMADRDYFDHKNPEGKGSRERHAEYDGCDSTNENIARFMISADGTAEIAKEIVDGWADSPGHYSVLVSKRPHVTGVGVYVTTDGIIYATQNFCREHPSA